jgi:cytoskeletal protein RodZ|tara:strand:+ start:70452 stop:71495 length:1044 start_codon:yes stop_codon:yes gene_type:complete
MALDTGSIPDEFRAHPDWKDPVPPITDAATLGDGLRAARKASNRSLEDMSAITRVHVRYLRALEQNDTSILPSRVFSIGYVRAYAGALGVDEQLAVERFKRDVPDPSVPLQAPVGIAFEEVRRYSPRIIGVLAIIGLAVLGWNVFQRVSLMSPTQPSDLVAVPESWSVGSAPGTVALDLPQPAPPDQTVPPLYVTRGLETELTGLTAADTEAAAAADAGTAPVQKAFNPRGAVYGAAATASQVVLQARKPTILVVRMSDGRVLFARQLAAGEAWRAPVGVQAVIDVADPSAFDVYLNGEHGGRLEQALTPLSQLNRRAETLARQATEALTRRTEAAVRAAQAMTTDG